MGRLGLIGGHSVLGVDVPEQSSRLMAETEWGRAEMLDAGHYVALQRHGAGEYTTAAKIDHRANIAGLADAGVDRVLAINSVGGLKPELAPGSFICPDDFIALHLGLSFHDDHGGERVPAFDPAWRERVLEAWSGLDSPPDLADGGVYWQSIGPRFETPAEIRLIAQHADVIGMTMGSEAILAGEMGISYCSVCIVDNLANGVAGERLTEEAFEEGKRANQERLLAALRELLPGIGADG